MARRMKRGSELYFNRKNSAVNTRMPPVNFANSESGRAPATPETVSSSC